MMMSLSTFAKPGFANQEMPEMFECGGQGCGNPDLHTTVGLTAPLHHDAVPDRQSPWDKYPTSLFACDLFLRAQPLDNNLRYLPYTLHSPSLRIHTYTPAQPNSEGVSWHPLITVDISLPAKQNGTSTRRSL